MKTVAERAGVSLMSVSRALRNEPGISTATRHRILEIADTLGYRPNPLVGALMANLRRAHPKESGQTIAFITLHSTPDGWRDFPTPATFYQGAKARAERLGFRLKDFWVNESKMPGSRVSAVLRARGIRGAILCPQPFPGRPVDLKWDDLAAVALGYSIPHPLLHRATNHQLHSIRLALTELTKRGYRRIGLAVETHYDARVDYNWTSGFLRYQSQIPEKDRIPILISSKLNRKEVTAWTRNHRPDAILAGFPLKWLNQTGIRIPEDVGFVDLDYHPMKGDIAGIDQSTQAVGRAATDLVVEQLYHNERGIPEVPKVVMIEGRWQEGRTVRALRKEPARAR